MCLEVILNVVLLLKFDNERDRIGEEFCGERIVASHLVIKGFVTLKTIGAGCGYR